MDYRAIFEAGKSVSRIENFYSTAIEESVRFSVRVKRGQFGPIDGSFLRSNSGSLKEFMHEIENYKQKLLDRRKEYLSIKQKFPDLPYFKDKSNMFRLESTHQLALTGIEIAISRLEEYLEPKHSSKKISKESQES